MSSKHRLVNFALALLLCLIGEMRQADVSARLNEGENTTIAAVGASLTAPAFSVCFGQMSTRLTSQCPNQFITCHNEAVSTPP